MLWENPKTSAVMLIKLHGPFAYQVAIKRFDDCTMFGDVEGESVWGDIVAELNHYPELMELPQSDFTVH